MVPGHICEVASLRKPKAECSWASMSLLCQACGNFSWVQLCSGQASKSRYQQFCCSCDPLMFHLPFACRVILQVIFLLASGDWNNDFLHQLGRLPINRWQVSIDMLDHVPGDRSLKNSSTCMKSCSMVPAWWVYYTPPSWLSLHRNWKIQEIHPHW